MGTSFSHFFLDDFDEKMTLAGCEREQNQTQSQTVQRADYLFKFLTT